MSATTRALFPALLLAASVTSAAMGRDSGDAASVSNPGNCKIVERSPDDNGSGKLSTSVTAGNGKVTAHTSGGNGVTVHSGNGSVSSSVATTGSGSTAVTSADGNCTIYVNPGEKRKDD